MVHQPYWGWDFVWYLNSDNVSALFTAVMAIATAGLIVVALFALGQINEARKSRHTVTAVDFSRRWEEPEMLEARNLVRKCKTPEGLKARFFELYDSYDDEALRMLRQSDYLEDLAILEGDGAISYRFVKRSLGHLVVSRWKMWELVADEFRERNGMDNYPHFRALADRLKDEPDLA